MAFLIILVLEYAHSSHADSFVERALALSSCISAVACLFCFLLNKDNLELIDNTLISKNKFSLSLHRLLH